MRALELRVAALEATAEQHQAKPCLLVLHPDSRDHNGQFIVRVNGESHIISRESSEPWPDFTGRLCDTFAKGLFTFFYLEPITAEATMPARAAVH